MAISNAAHRKGGVDTTMVKTGTLAEFTAAAPVLARGEVSFVSDTKRLKIGDGKTAWGSLNYVRGGPGIVEAGTVTLVGGTKTVTTANATATAVILVSGQTDGAGTEGNIRVSTITAGTSFVITSSEASDVSTVGYVIIEP